MNTEYKDIEIKSFAQSALKVLVALLVVAFFVTVFMYFSKQEKIDKGYNINNHLHEIILDYRALMLNIERPSIYTDFEDTGNKLTDITIKVNQLVKMLKASHQMNDTQERELRSSLDELREHIKRFNSVVGIGSSDFKSLNVLYYQVDILDVKQRVLEFIFMVKFYIKDLEDFIVDLQQRVVQNSKMLEKLNHDVMKFKRISSYKTKLTRTQMALIDRQEKLDYETTFLKLSVKLLQSVHNLHIVKEQILNYLDFENMLTGIKMDTISKIEHLKKTKEQILIACLVLFLLICFFILVIFKYSYELIRALDILYKAFMNSPIQQVLLQKSKKNGAHVEFVNDSFSYDIAAQSGQSTELRKAQAYSFFESIDNLIDIHENKSGFDLGTLIQESHNKVQAYNENDGSNRREVRYYSVFRKNVNANMELVSKVDVTKKISQIKDYKFRLINMQRRLETDSLTGLLSLQALQDRELRENKSNRNSIFLYMKINNFNDLRLNYSTVIIDEIIKTFANSLKNAISLSDSQNDLEKIDIYHLQLDEFCIVYPDIQSAVNTAKMIQKHFCPFGTRENIKDKFELYINQDLTVKDLELNIGISTDRDIRKSSKEVLNRLAQAILASYETALTDTAYCIYQDGLLIEKQHAEQQRVVALIRYALDNDKVFVVCQGVHDAKTGAISYYEVLVRIRNEANEVVSPGVFLDVARRAGLYKDIQLVVIRKVFAMVEKYHNANFSINLANSDIINDETREYFLERLYNCSRPHALCVEVLESESVESYDELQNFLETISKNGVKIAIDDFGSGYSNFYRLLKIRFDYLKIDGSIIEGLVGDANARIVLETLVGFAHKQGYQVVAEFVKNAEILKIVQDYGIEKAQGYELSKPEEPEAIFE